MKVPHIPLWQLCDFSSKYKGVEKYMQPNTVQVPKCTAKQAKELDTEDGGIPVYTAGMVVYHTTKAVAGDYVCGLRDVIGIGDALSMDTVKWLEAPFVVANNQLAVVRDQTIILPKFLFYVLKHAVRIERCYRGVTLRSACMDEILRLEIPVPPMAQQREIIRWLEAVESTTVEFQDYANSYMQNQKKLKC